MITELKSNCMPVSKDGKFSYNILFEDSFADLPEAMADLELEKDDKLEDVLEATMANQEMTHTPYPVTKEMIYQAIQDLEDYKG